jgi:hypothetical protein
MRTHEKSAAKTQGEHAYAEPMNLTKRIGSTTYLVSVHFNKESKETVQDKIIRLIENEVRNSA